MSRKFFRGRVTVNRMTAAVVKSIRDLLDRENVDYDYLEHAEAVSAEAVAELRPGYTLGEGSKALMVSAGGEVVQLVIPGDKKFSNSKVRKLLGVQQLRFLTEEELGDVTGGVLPGGTPPFGNLFGIRVYADEGVVSRDRMIFSAGLRSVSIGVRVEDYVRLVNPTVADIVQ